MLRSVFDYDSLENIPLAVCDYYYNRMAGIIVGRFEFLAGVYVMMSAYFLFMATGKHVIFLGAGASKNSGYPLADELRKLISSRRNWMSALDDYQKKHCLKSSIKVHLPAVGQNLWDRNADALRLFREGGFATIDEFCKLAGGFKFQQEVHGLRSVVRAALGMFNPEEDFEGSEYYAFVQALFKKDLLTLRDDISVLTFNYDPYLEFLLYRALCRRWSVMRKAAVTADDLKTTPSYKKIINEVTSGFFDPLDEEWHSEAGTNSSFNLLQLHGSICYGADFEMLFSDDVEARARVLLELNPVVTPPIMFPWEIVNDKGIIEEKQFRQEFDPAIFPLFSGIWKRAQQKVHVADKISFVGLSMHQFLQAGLSYLFRGKKNKFEIVVANPDNVAFEGAGTGTHWSELPFSPANALITMLKKAEPDISFAGHVRFISRRSDRDVTLVNDFSSFIKTQMTPVQLS